MRMSITTTTRPKSGTRRSILRARGPGCLSFLRPKELDKKPRGADVSAERAAQEERAEEHRQSQEQLPLHYPLRQGVDGHQRVGEEKTAEEHGPQRPDGHGQKTEKKEEKKALKDPSETVDAQGPFGGTYLGGTPGHAVPCEILSLPRSISPSPRWDACTR